MSAPQDVPIQAVIDNLLNEIKLLHNRLAVVMAQNNHLSYQLQQKEETIRNIQEGKEAK